MTPPEASHSLATASPAAAVTVTIRQYALGDHAAVLALFQEGMLAYEAHAANAASRAYIQRSMEGDLDDIPGAFIVPGGNFWVATATDNTREVVVGMVALEKKTNSDGELRRMSVKQEFRGLGVGKLLVLELEQWARANGFANVTLSTGQVMLSAQKFYLSVGFAQRETVVVCVDPYYADVLFVKRLS